MEDKMIYVWACLLFLVLVVGWIINLFGLPGNWLNLAAAICYAFFMPADERVSISWWIVGIVLLLAVLGEVVEFLAGAAGAAKVGGSRRGVVLSVLGSFIGGVFGAIIGAPIPVVGPIIAVLLFASLGALAGAMLGEWWKGRDWEARWQVGNAAFWGRLLGTVGKVYIGTVIVVVVLAALVMM
jgi:uncharacterized protein YqgC (DUF456 family)